MAPKTSDNPIAPVGESVTRLDARAKVTGSATYADDFQFGPGLLARPRCAQPAPDGVDQESGYQRSRSDAWCERYRHRKGFRRHARSLSHRPLYSLP